MTLPIITRDKWGANPPTAPFVLRQGKAIVIMVHHTASDHTQWKGAESIQNLQAWHQNGRGFKDIGYHYIISPQGEIYEGRPVKTEGAHCSGWNNKAIGVAVYGRYDIVTPSPLALKALVTLCKALRKEFPITKIVGHRDLAVTKCPGGYLYYELENIRRECELQTEQGGR